MYFVSDIFTYFNDIRRLQGWHTKHRQRRKGLTVRASAEMNSTGAAPQEQLVALMYNLADAAVAQPAAVQVRSLCA